MKKRLMYVIALIFVCLTISVFSSLAYGAATVSPASSIFIAGSSNNDVTINITGATIGTVIVITPPTGWNGTGATTSSGYATVLVGSELTP